MLRHFVLLPTQSLWGIFNVDHDVKQIGDARLRSFHQDLHLDYDATAFFYSRPTASSSWLGRVRVTSLV